MENACICEFYATSSMEFADPKELRIVVLQTENAQHSRVLCHGVRWFPRAPNLALKNSEGLLVLWTEPDDRARSVTAVGTKPALVFSSCLLPLRWPTARKRVSAHPVLPHKRESPTTGHPSGFASRSRTAQRTLFPVGHQNADDVLFEKFENGNPLCLYAWPNPLTLLSNF